MKKIFKFSLLLFPFLMNFLPLSRAAAASVETIPIEGEPMALTVDEGSGRLFSLNFFNRTISVIDEKKFQVLRTVNLKKRINRNVGTNAILYVHSLNKLFVSTGGGEVLIFNGSSFELTDEIRIERFIPDLASDGDLLYLLDWSGNIHKYRGKQKETLINYGYRASPYMHLGGNNRIYLALGKKGLLVIDAEKGEVLKKLEIDAYSTPASGAGYVYVAGPGRLYVISDQSLEVVKTISVNFGNYGGLGTVFNRNKGYVYVITEGDTVTAVDPRGAGRIVEKIEVCHDPKALVVNEQSGTVYVACPRDGMVEAIKYGGGH